MRVLRHLGSLRVLRSRPADDGLAEGRDRASPSGTASRAAPDGANRWPDGRPADSSGEMLVEHQDSIVRGQVACPAVRRSLCKTASRRGSAVSPGSGNELSSVGTKTKSCVAGWRSAHSRSLSIVGPSTYRSAINTRFGALGCLVLAPSGRVQQLSLLF